MSKRSIKNKLERSAIRYLQLVLVVLLLWAHLVQADTDAPPLLDLAPVAQPLVWTQQDQGTPPSIKVYVGTSTTNDGQPIRAWYVDVDYNDTNLRIRPHLSNAVEGKEAVSVMGRQLGAYVAINGGYFDMARLPAQNFSLVKANGTVMSKNIARVIRSKQSFFLTRSAFGVKSDRTFDISWIAHLGDDIYSYAEPNPHMPQVPAAPPSQTYPTGAAPWRDITDAIGAGPILVRDGKVRITYDEEVFFGSGYERFKPYPRSAVGYTANNHLILFVVDGKRPEHSRGLTLGELADEMLRLGCISAMNLDGGGSTTLVVNGTVLNQPSGGTERKVTSALTVVPATAPPSSPISIR